MSAEREPRRECAAKAERSDDAEGGLRVGVGDSVGVVGWDKQSAEGVRGWDLNKVLPTYSGSRHAPLRTARQSGWLLSCDWHFVRPLRPTARFFSEPLFVERGTTSENMSERGARTPARMRRQGGAQRRRGGRTTGGGGREDSNKVLPTYSGSRQAPLGRRANRAVCCLAIGTSYAPSDPRRCHCRCHCHCHCHCRCHCRCHCHCHCRCHCHCHCH